jgi:hypothetical protein
VKRKRLRRIGQERDAPSTWTPDPSCCAPRRNGPLCRDGVEDVTGLAVAVELAIAPTVARAIDAGPFVTRLPTLAAFRPLATLIARRHDRTRTPADAA